MISILLDCFVLVLLLVVALVMEIAIQIVVTVRQIKNFLLSFLE